MILLCFWDPGYSGQDYDLVMIKSWIWIYWKQKKKKNYADDWFFCYRISLVLIVSLANVQSYVYCIIFLQQPSTPPYCDGAQWCTSIPLLPTEYLMTHPPFQFPKSGRKLFLRDLGYLMIHGVKQKISAQGGLFMAHVTSFLPSPLTIHAHECPHFLTHEDGMWASCSYM